MANHGDVRHPLYIGCISGTSVDGLDLCAIRLNGDGCEFLASQTTPFETELQNTLLALGQPDRTWNIDELGEADARLGTFIGSAIVQFMSDQQIDPATVTAIGSHGQTIRHRPGIFTMQIGDPSRIVEICQITTVADFRRRDFAAGGQGAPLVPPFHQFLFPNQLGDVILNIGGISNISVLGDHVSGFDTGPGNALMDWWYAQHHPGEWFDPEGGWAAAGTIDHQLLEVFLEDPYFNQPAPKSTGREHFDGRWLQARIEDSATSAQDIQATLAEFTARTVALEVTKHAPNAKAIWVCGGGRLNLHLMQRLAAQSNLVVSPVEQLGIDGDYIEAAAFGWLAHQTLQRLPGNSPATTGASGERILGSVHWV